MGRKEVKFDVMSNGYFVCSMKIPVEDGHVMKLKDLKEYVYTKRPSLKYKRITLAFDELEVDLAPVSKYWKKSYDEY